MAMMASISSSTKAISQVYLFIVPHKHNFVLRGMIDLQINRSNDHYDQNIKADVHLRSTVMETYHIKVSALLLISLLSKMA